MNIGLFSNVSSSITFDHIWSTFLPFKKLVPQTLSLSLVISTYFNLPLPSVAEGAPAKENALDLSWSVIKVSDTSLKSNIVLYCSSL